MPVYSNPLELAKSELGTQFDPSTCGPITQQDDGLIARLHRAARDNDLMGVQYWAKTDKGLVVPANTPSENPEFRGTFIELKDLTYAGELDGFHKFSLGQSAAAWCLRFSQVRLIPGLETLSDRKELWVPAVSLREIDRL